MDRADEKGGSEAPARADEEGGPGARMAASPRARQVRGEPLVEKVLEATLDELARVGYAALSVEAVAERAGVNKTTVYRRWATKEELVSAAIRREADAAFCISDTGSLRSDLVAMLTELRDLLRSRRGQTLIRMILAESLSPEVARLVEEVRADKEDGSKSCVARAVARGELPSGTDVDLVFSMLAGTVHHLFLFRDETPSDERLGQIVDLVLDGARRGGGRARAAAAS